MSFVSLFTECYAVACEALSLRKCLLQEMLDNTDKISPVTGGFKSTFLTTLLNYPTVLAAICHMHYRWISDNQTDTFRMP